MSAAIHTKYIGPTNRRGSRIKAATKDGKGDMALTIPYPHELPQDQKHVAAAKALAERLGWSGTWVVGHNEDGSVSCVHIGHATLATSHLYRDAEYFEIYGSGRD